MGLAALPRTPWRRRLRQLGRAPPRAAVEDSVSLRAGVQGLVAIGIVAVDGAAGTAMSAWALPASLAGAAWSWYRRYRNNAAVKAAIALGMVLALAAFFGQLLGSLNDMRLVLARLLVQLQVLHSFDLPRRQDLGYSMAIGLILLGVAGTLAQTL
ncbi:MAG: transglutaminase, partial [Cyanobacteria bacterium QS_8_64_29]